MHLFSPDSKLMISLSRLGDLVVLNFVFILTCLPVFTIGAALTALYTVTFRNLKEWENGLAAYFKAFRDNFKQATVIWLLLLVVGACTLFDVMLFRQMTGMLHYLYVPSVILFVLVIFTASYTFPLLSQFNNGNKQTLKNALLMSLGYLPRSLLIGAMNAIPFMLLSFDLLLFMNAAFLWVFLYFSAIAYFNALLLKKVFAPYLEKEEDA